MRANCERVYRNRHRCCGCGRFYLIARHAEHDSKQPDSPASIRLINDIISETAK
ncbi:MAG: hypothetical protein ACLUKN_08630 [Bacilli bacterium]